MIKSLAIERQSIKTKTLVTALGILSCILLPQIFHAIGAAAGLGSALGAAFLPMHLPVLFTGLLCGTAAGLLCGLLSPAISFAISGMPAAAMLPFMTIELACYGLVSGMLSKSKMPVIAKILISQISGRAVRALAILAAIYLFNNQSLNIAQTWNIVLTGLPGIVLQLCILPLLMYRVDNIHE